MKKIMALILAAVMLCAAFGAAAEEGQMAPLYATVEEALKACDENRVIAGGENGEYYAVVTQKDGKYYRSVANWDEKLTELNDALDSLDYEAEDFIEKHEAAMQAFDDYLKTLPIAYSEEFTAAPLSDVEMEKMKGKTLAQLEEEGYEVGGSGTENDENGEMVIAFYLRCGVFDYRCLVDADFDRYEEAQENNSYGDLTVTGAELAGITEQGFDKRFHADGTVDDPVDPFAELGEIMAEFAQLIEKAAAGEEVDMKDFAETMKEKHPDYADMIDLYMTMYETYGAEGLASMMNPVESAEPAAPAE